MDRKTWRDHWDDGEYPSLPCPSCGSTLNWDETALACRTPDHNRELVRLTDNEEARSRFAGWFSCGHSKCGEAVAVSGDCTYEYADGDGGETILKRRFHPTAMHPPPPVMRLADEVPEEIRDVLALSFGLLWTSRESCAGRLRVVVELILEQDGFPGEPSPGKFVSLDKRIGSWESRYGACGIAKSLRAIKWLGNVGVHETDVSRDRLLDAYEILDRVVKQIFPPDERHLDEKADELVKTRGRGS